MVDPITLKGSFYSPNYGHWSRPYYDPLFTGKIMDPKGRDLEYHGGGLRGSKWFDRMIRDKYDDLVKGIQNIVDGGK